MKTRKLSERKLPPTSTTNLPIIQQKRATPFKPPSESKRRQRVTTSTAKSTEKNQKLEKIIPSKSKMPILNRTKRTVSSMSLPYNSENQVIKKKYSITAQAYGVYTDSLQPIIEFNAEDRRQIASLTKMMTMMTVLKLTQKYNVQLKTTYFRVSVNGVNVTGTVAELDPKQWVTVQDLLYALMLPSGNDAAIVLAQNLGAYIYYEKQGQSKALSCNQQRNIEIKSLDVTNDSTMLRHYNDNFVKHMNFLAKQYELQSTIFMNPHGLDCKQAYSTVRDLSILIRKVLQNPISQKVISCRNYFARLKISIGKKQICYREIDWINTNRLMWKKGFIGGKTGQTNGAGACLVNVFEDEGKKYFIIVLGCQSREDRFNETEKLVNAEILKIQ